jgi:hypothetical protein
MNYQRLLTQCVKRFLTRVPALDTEARPDAISAAAIKRELEVLSESLPERADVKLLQAAALVAHDHFDTALRLLGKRDDQGANYLRGLMLRRQGDYAGACKAFRSIGQWGPLLLLGERLQQYDDAATATVLRSFAHLVARQGFNPTPMCGIVQQVCQGGHKGLHGAIAAVQLFELQVLFEWFAGKGHRRAGQLSKQLAKT